ncbi:hypothetical protein BV20DRAFT_974039, partial [Pilatotrama ljubarskyi]
MQAQTAVVPWLASFPLQHSPQQHPPWTLQYSPSYSGRPPCTSRLGGQQETPSGIHARLG